MILLVAAALAQSPRLTLAGGVFETVATDATGGGGVVGRAILQSGRVAAEAGIREGYLFGADRTVGAVVLGARYVPDNGPHARIAFLHHHETPWEIARRYPVQTALGSHSGISHRSGLELGVGVDIPVLQRGYQERLGLGLDLAVGAFPDRGGAAGYVMFEQTFTVDLGRR